MSNSTRLVSRWFWLFALWFGLIGKLSHSFHLSSTGDALRHPFRSFFSLGSNNLDTNIQKDYTNAVGITADNGASTQSNQKKTNSSNYSTQKNLILLDKLQNCDNLNEEASKLVNYCDEGFNEYLDELIADAETEHAKSELGVIRYEVNNARRNKLITADSLLRSILSSGGLKQMEAKLRMHLRKSDIDMAFMVVLQLNLEDAINANAETAVQVMTHLGTLITEYQDDIVTPTVRLLRLLVRTEDHYTRMHMLRQKLLIGRNLQLKQEIEARHQLAQKKGTTAADPASSSISGVMKLEPQSSTVPQCEHIVVDAVEKWGVPDVTVEDLNDAIDDLLNQMIEIRREKESVSELNQTFNQIRQEIVDVVAELDVPKQSDRCDDSDSRSSDSSDSSSSIPIIA